jgi:pyruvate dehydrogenase E1 component alpha subunit
MIAKSKEQPAAPAVQNGFSLISNQKLLQIYSTMLQCRMIGERARLLSKQNKFSGKYDAPAGQEAAAVGVAIDLLPQDAVSAFFSDIIPLFVKRMSLKKLLGRAAGPAVTSLTRAARLDHTLGAAMDPMAKSNSKITVIFSSFKSTPLSFWQKALNSAGDRNLPILFVSLSTLRGDWLTYESDAKSNHGKRKACSCPTITVDGNDAVAVYRVATESIAHARKGDGPTHIECIRSKDDDPLLNMERYLIRKGLFSEKFKRQAIARFSKRLDAAVDLP